MNIALVLTIVMTLATEGLACSSVSHKCPSSSSLRIETTSIDSTEINKIVNENNCINNPCINGECSVVAILATLDETVRSTLTSALTILVKMVDNAFIWCLACLATLGT